VGVSALSVAGRESRRECFSFAFAERRFAYSIRYETFCSTTFCVLAVILRDVNTSVIFVVFLLVRNGDVVT